MAIIASKNASPSERIATAYQRLTESASHLNIASDELGTSIRALDHALAKLNLGIKTWIKSGGWENPDSTYEDHHLGYAKVGSKWGIALSVTRGMRGWEEDATYEGEWLFNDAPRALRAESIDALPELVEALVQAADETTAKIMDKTAGAKQLAKTVTALAQVKK